MYFLPQLPIPTITKPEDFLSIINSIYPTIDLTKFCIDPGLFHICALYQAFKCEELYTLVINETAPKSDWDFLCLNFARAIADLIISSASIQRSEPDLDISLLGRPDVVKSLQTFRNQIVAKRQEQVNNNNNNPENPDSLEDCKFADILFLTRLINTNTLSKITDSFSNFIQKQQEQDENHTNIKTNNTQDIIQLLLEHPPQLSPEFCNRHVERKQSVFIHTHYYIIKYLETLQTYLKSNNNNSKLDDDGDNNVIIQHDIINNWIALLKNANLTIVEDDAHNNNNNNEQNKNENITKNNNTSGLIISASSTPKTTEYPELIESALSILQHKKQNNGNISSPINSQHLNAISIESGPNTTQHLYFQPYSNEKEFKIELLPEYVFLSVYCDDPWKSNNVANNDNVINDKEQESKKVTLDKTKLTSFYDDVEDDADEYDDIKDLYDECGVCDSIDDDEYGDITMEVQDSNIENPNATINEDDNSAQIQQLPPQYNPPTVCPKKNIVRNQQQPQQTTLNKKKHQTLQKTSYSTFGDADDDAEDDGNIDANNRDQEKQKHFENCCVALTNEVIDKYYELATIPTRPYAIIPQMIMNPFNGTVFSNDINKMRQQVNNDKTYEIDNNNTQQNCQQIYHDGTIDLIDPSTIPLFNTNQNIDRNINISAYAEEYNKYNKTAIYSDIYFNTQQSIILPFLESYNNNNNTSHKDGGIIKQLDLTRQQDVIQLLNEITAKQLITTKAKAHQKDKISNNMTLDWSKVPFSFIQQKLGWTMFLLRRRK